MLSRTELTHLCSFRDWHGGWRRDLVLSLGRRFSESALTELARGAGTNEPAAVATAIQHSTACLGPR